MYTNIYTAIGSCSNRTLSNIRTCTICILTEHVHLGGVIKVEVARSQTHSQPLSKALPEWRSPGRLCVKRYTTCQRLLLQPRAYNGGGGERVSYLQYTALKLKMQSYMTICAYTCTCSHVHVIYMYSASREESKFFQFLLILQ